MDQMFKRSKRTRALSFLPTRQWQLLVAALGVVIIASWWPSSQKTSSSGRQSLALPTLGDKQANYQLQDRTPESQQQSASSKPEPSAKEFRPRPPASNETIRNETTQATSEVKTPMVSTSAQTHFYTIADGDTLGKIFDKFSISQTTMYQVLEADLNVLALDTLSLGHKLSFEVDAQQQLQTLTLYFNPAQQIIFYRVDETSFEYKTIALDGDWEKQSLSGEIHGSFYVSATKAGLSPAEIQQVTRLFKDRLRFSRDLRAGDQFKLVRNRQFIDGEATGISEISAVILYNRNREFNAYLFEDGNYYDQNGESLARAFMRVPLKHNYRVSSPFDPRRRHPITRRISPHNGADFAVPIGTPVLAAGDGIVTRVEKHPYAGKYLVIDHGGKYRTRYLHLNKFKVRRGDAVKRGDTIALSGNTGRSTGPHLHYELHINGHPVDPMRAKIPMAESIDPKQKPNFNAFISAMNELMI